MNHRQRHSHLADASRDAGAVPLVNQHRCLSAIGSAVDRDEQPFEDQALAFGSGKLIP